MVARGFEVLGTNQKSAVSRRTIPYKNEEVDIHLVCWAMEARCQLTQWQISRGHRLSQEELAPGSGQTLQNNRAFGGEKAKSEFKVGLEQKMG
jgi:hypothetical protein